MAGTFKGKAPGTGAGDMSSRTQALRPAIELPSAVVGRARRMRREGHEPGQIAAALDAPLEEIEKALVQMRMPRPETTRGTLNVTLAAHQMVMRERKGDEPVWLTFDRMMDELLRHRTNAEAAGRKGGAAVDRSRRNGAAPAAALGAAAKEGKAAQLLLLP